MRKNILIVVINVTLLSVMLSGCLNNPNGMSDETAKEKIIGLWERVDYNTNQTWQFKQDGNITISGTDLNASYVFENGSLFIYYYAIEYLDKHQYRFDGDDVLILNVIAGGGAIDPDTGMIVDPNDTPMINEFIFHRIL